MRVPLEHLQGFVPCDRGIVGDGLPCLLEVAQIYGGAVAPWRRSWKIKWIAVPSAPIGPRPKDPIR